MPNDNTPLIELAKAPVGNPEIIKTLEQALAAAKAGNLVGLALVAVHGPEVLNCAFAGGFPATAVVGCQKLSAQLTDALFAKRSPILRPMGH